VTQAASIAGRLGAYGLASALCCLSCAGSTTPQASAAPTQVTAAPSSHGREVPSTASADSVGDSDAASPPSPKGTEESRLVERMLRRVEAARGLSATKTVPGIQLDRAALIARVKAHVSRELPPEAIRDEGLALSLFGFVPTQFDYEAAEYQLLEDQLAGYYEPADGTMYMARDLGDDEATATLAHELVHALQDQHWNLEQRAKYKPGDGDRSEAVSALAEGDATSAMFDVMLQIAAPGGGRSALDLPDDVFVAQIRAGMSQGPGATAPQVMRGSLAAPYIYGTLFVNALRQRGGWGEVDRAWDDPPTTTEQILHVDKWLAHEPALAVTAPPFASLGAGWRVADEDSEGEIGVRIAFEEWMAPSVAAEASSGWGGDRGVLVTQGHEAAFAWRLRYDPGKSKEERTARAHTTLLRALDGALGPAQIAEPAFVCRERPDRGPLALARAGADLVFTLGPAETDGTGWRSAGTCAQSRKWIKEIVAGSP
jgi:hypothetical protein